MAKYKYIGPNMILTDRNGNKSEHPANCYGGNKLKTGDTVELDGWLASKADKNPNYQKIKPGPKPKKAEESKEDFFGASAKDKQ